ncbi:MAG TPA: PD-(D/E)XK nuclease family protein, partial [Clostridiales bacterium]|nr:PD-(D/E)XK nuclease family protein [Clostridiales bacterium]
FERFGKKLQNTDGEGAARAVYELLTSLDVPGNLRDLAFELEEEGEPVLALELQRLWDDLMDILDSFAGALGKKSVSPRRVADLFDLIIQGRSLGSLPQGIDEVTIGSADRMRTSSPRAVFVIGANEGVFPQNPASTGILNDEDRNLLLEMGLEVDEPGTHKVKGERFIVYDTLCSAAERLTVSFARKDMAGASLSPSEIISTIKQNFPNCLVIDTVDVPDLHFVEGEGPAFETMAKLMRQGNKLYVTLRAYFEGKEEYKDRLKALDRVVKNDNFSMEDKEAAQDLFGKNMSVSPSKAEAYFQCAFKYFCSYGLKAKPRLAAEFDSLQTGSVSHYVLEALLTKFPGHEIIRVDRAAIRQEIKRALNAYIEEKMGGFEDKPESFIYRYERISRVIENTVDRLIEELENCSFEPVALELKIGEGCDIEPYEIKFEDGRKLSINGSIDRVDKMQANGKNYLRVIDYKSSGKRFELSRVFDGLNMQMLIYLFALWKNGGQSFDNPVPAGILYVTTEAPPVNLDRNADQKEVEKAIKKNSKMNGLVLEDELVVKGMENGADGIFIPAKISKGELSGNLISLDQLKKLNDKTDEILSSMVEALHGGEIPAVPAYIGSNYKACQFCDYRDGCGYEDGMPTKPITRLKHEEALMLLEEEEEASAMDR